MEGDSRLLGAVEVLRGGRTEINPDLVADLLEVLAPLATYWHETYAAPFVPVFQSAIRLSVQICESEFP